MESNQVMKQIKEKYQQVEILDNHLLVPETDIKAVMKELRDAYGYNVLSNETAVDYQEYFEVIYNICRVPEGDMINIKVKIDREKAEIPSVVDIWPSAGWQEREIFDLLGIRFTDHPDMRRILLEDDFEGHPLRRDFKWVGGRD
ncbi:MAG: NADH-quinone oxidoreductase subunit C [Firmicutes bacterium]|nr:NADH-quinone oxidoreductase subunit C [Bacillota bacterium]